MKRMFLTMAGVALALSGAAADYTITWTDPTKGLTDVTYKQTITDEATGKTLAVFSYTNGPMSVSSSSAPKALSIKTLDVYPDAGGKITFTKDSDPMTFFLNSAINQGINVHDGKDSTIIFQNIVSNRCQNMNVYGMSMSGEVITLDGLLTHEWQLLAAGKKLKDYNLGQQLQPKVPGMANTENTMFAHIVKRTSDWMLAQYRGRSIERKDPLTSTTRYRTLFVKAEFEQRGDDIWVRSPTDCTWQLWADKVATYDYTGTAPYNVIYDIDTVEAGADRRKVGLFTGAGSPQDNTCVGLKQINLVVRSDAIFATVRYEGPTDYYSSIQPSAHVRVEYPNSPLPTGSSKNVRQLSGSSSEIVIQDTCGEWKVFNNYNSINHNGPVVFETTKAPTGDPLTERYEPFLPTSYAVIAKGHKIEDLLVSPPMEMAKFVWVNDNRPSNASYNYPVNTNDYTWAYFAGTSFGGNSLLGAISSGAADYEKSIPCKEIHPGNLVVLEWGNEAHTNATAQFQCQLGNRIFSAYVGLMQNGDGNIYGKVMTPYSMVYTNAQGVITHKIGVDFDTIGTAGWYGEPLKKTSHSIATMPTNGTCGVWNLNLKFKKPKENVLSMTSDSGTNAMSAAGCFVVRSDDPANRQVLAICTDRVLPINDNSVNRIERGGEMRLCTGTSASMTKCDFQVTEGGLLRTKGNSVFNANMSVELIGGKLELGYLTSGNNVGTYLYSPILRDGAEITSWDDGTFPQRGVVLFAGSKGCRLTVCGNSPSTNNVDLSLMADKDATSTAEFLIGKTGEGTYDVDFVQNGAILNYWGTVPYMDATFRKTGDGTMLLNGDFTSSRPAVLANGTLKLGKSITWFSAAGTYLLEDVLPSLAFEGGNFAVADGTTNSVGAIARVTKPATVTVGENAELAFADSSAESDWAAMLRVTVPEGSRVRFGTCDSALTAEQLSKLRVNGRRVTLDTDGTAVPSGFIMVIR